MLGRRESTDQPALQWSRHKLLALLIGAGLACVLLVVGIALAVGYAVRPAQHAARRDTVTGAGPTNGGNAAGTVQRVTAVAARDALADKPMTGVDDDASHPGPVSTADPGAPIILPAATGTGPAHVPTGFPHTTEGAMAQLAAIDQIALQSGTLQGARGVITGWAMPGGPTPVNWSGVQALAEFFDGAGLSGGGTNQLAIVVSPLMGRVKGSVGADFTVPCVDFEIDVTLQQTSRGAAADCQRMQWTGTRWMIAAGAEPSVPPSVWPDTDTAIAVGYRDLQRATTR